MLRELVAAVRIDTAYGPPIVLVDPFAPGEPNPLLQALKPRVTLYAKGGYVEPVSMAPYGEPGPSQWPAVKGALILGGIALVLLTVVVIARRR